MSRSFAARSRWGRDTARCSRRRASWSTRIARPRGLRSTGSCSETQDRPAISLSSITRRWAGPPVAGNRRATVFAAWSAGHRASPGSASPSGSSSRTGRRRGGKGSSCSPRSRAIPRSARRRRRAGDRRSCGCPRPRPTSPSCGLTRGLILATPRSRGASTAAASPVRFARRLRRSTAATCAPPRSGSAPWGLLQEARAARDAGRDDEAEAKLLESLGRAPARDRWHADLALADLYSSRKQRQKAEGHYRDVLASVPDQPDALRALATILVQDGRYEEAAPVNDRLLRVDAQKAFRPGWLRAEILRAGSARNRESGNLARAREQLVAARREDPSNVWVLHDLANVLLESGSPAEAQPVAAELLRLAPSLPEALVVDARLRAALGDASGALSVLSSLPPPRDPSVLALRRRLEVQVEIPRLIEAARRGERTAVAQRLAALERAVAQEPELAAHVAVAWSKLGDNQRALALMRSAMAKAPGATRGAQLELASTLLEAGDDEAVGRIVAGLERDRSLTAAERRSLAEVRVVHAVRVADRNREAGNDRAAAQALEAVERSSPGDARVVAARARLLERSDPAR